MSDFLFRKRWWEIAEMLGSGDREALVAAIVDFTYTGACPYDDGPVGAVFEALKPELETARAAIAVSEQ